MDLSIFRTPDGRLNVERLALKYGESRLRLSGAMPLDEHGAPGALSLEGRVLLDLLSQLLPGADAWQTGGVADVSATLTGNHAALDAGRLDNDPRRPAPLAIHPPSHRERLRTFGSSRMDRSARDHVQRKRRHWNASDRRIPAASPDLKRVPEPPPRMLEQPARFSAQVDNLRFSGKGEQSAAATFGFKMAGEASALNVEALQATVDFSELLVKAGNRDLRQVEPAHVTIAGGVARLENLDAKGAGSSLKASGSVVLRGEYPLEFDLAGQTDLALFAPLAAPLEAAGGMRLEAHVSGTLNDPRTTGFCGPRSSHRMRYRSQACGPQA